jgi:hypothetical protein
MTIEPVTRALDAADVSYALIGAHAMAVRGYPRFAVDVDLLTTDARVLDEATWVTLPAARARRPVQLVRRRAVAPHCAAKEFGQWQK